MQLNHVLIRTNDIEVMITFFVDVIGLKLGFRPPFSFEGVWLYSEEKHLIHLVNIDKNDQEQLKYLGQNTSSQSQSPSSGMGIIDHIAFQGESYDDLLDILEAQGICYTKREVPLTKELQVFVYGPEELIIEIIFPL